jgi:predicted nucleic acid-binding protein
VKFTVDTNVLIRVFVDDDQKQAQAARKLLKSAELIAVTSSSLCEFVGFCGRLTNSADKMSQQQ